MSERRCSQCGGRFSARPCGFAHLEIRSAGGWTRWKKLLDPPVTASGGNAETTEERQPQPPAEQPQRRLPLDDDS